MNQPTPTPTPRTDTETDITFHCGQASQEIMRLDEDGMTYKGQRIEDGGGAHRAFLRVMSAMQPTPRKDTGITFTEAYTCTHHNDAERTACPVCLVAAITAERDHWQEIAKAASAEREHNANVAQAMTAERDQLHAQLHALTLICGTNDANKFETWVDRANARAERAEAALTTEREKVRTLRSALENLCDEQNGAPLETRRDQWQLAMDEARAAIVATEGAK